MDTPMDRPILLQLNNALPSFRNESGTSSEFVFAIIVGLVVLVLIAVLTTQLRRRMEVKRLGPAHANNRFRLLSLQYGLGVDQQRLLETLADSKDVGKLLPLLESRAQFEDAAGRLRLRDPQLPALKRIGPLRQKLGYGFGNPRNPFETTRMLAVGQKMRCGIPFGEREVWYVTTVLGVGEHQFFVRPPTRGGKPVTLPSIPRVLMRVSRNDDADYELSAVFVGQTQNAARALILRHALNIRKLFFREAKRVPMQVPVRFVIFTHDEAEERDLSRLDWDDRNTRHHSGLTRDMSIGGAQISVPVQERIQPSVGDKVLFKLPEAMISQELMADVVNIARDAQQLRLHLRFEGLNELSRLKLNKFLQSHDHSAGAHAPSAAASTGRPHRSA